MKWFTLVVLISIIINLILTAKKFRKVRGGDVAITKNELENAIFFEFLSEFTLLLATTYIFLDRWFG